MAKAKTLTKPAGRPTKYGTTMEQVTIRFTKAWLQEVAVVIASRHGVPARTDIIREAAVAGLALLKSPPR